MTHRRDRTRGAIPILSVVALAALFGWPLRTVLRMLHDWLGY